MFYEGSEWVTLIFFPRMEVIFFFFLADKFHWVETTRKNLKILR